MQTSDKEILTCHVHACSTLEHSLTGSKQHIVTVKWTEQNKIGGEGCCEQNNKEP